MQVSGRALGSSGCSCSTIPHQFGRQVLTFQNRSLLQSKRAVAQRVVAASTPVATVEKKLKKTASKIADTAKDVAEKVTPSAKPDLSKVVLLQGENVPSFPSDPRAMPDPIRALQHTRHISAQLLLFNVCRKTYNNITTFPIWMDIVRFCFDGIEGLGCWRLKSHAAFH